MALSYYSTWPDSFQQQFIDSDAAILADDPELQALLHGDAFLFSDQTFNNTLLSDDFTNGLLLPPQNPIFPHQEIEFHPFQYPSKRQKCCDFFPPNFCQTEYPPPPFLDFPAAGYSCGSVGSEGATSAAAAGSVSAQSAAARQRRRRITEKTQELGKLVPGGQKMNTAEMLQSAHKYIKFLQAQVAILESVGLNNKEVAEEPFVEGEEVLQILLQSPLIQEKLYSTENCLVPQKLVDEKEVKSSSHLITNDH